jgi:crotonobetainyl-CoA:carnitine CoA-transferase CaiB-like acyl-CoA transferase
VRANLSLGDSLAGLEATIGVLLALRARDADPERRGQTIDVAIFESVFAVLESTVAEFARLGEVRAPSGTTISGVVPSNLYPAQDGRSVVIGANNAANFARLMRAVGRADLADDPALAANAARVRRQGEIDGAIAAWTATLGADEIVERLAEVSVPASRVYSVADMAADPHYAARGLFEVVTAGERSFTLPAVGPKLSETPARTDWPGRALGADTRAVLGERLGLSDAELDQLVAAGVVAG